MLTLPKLAARNLAYHWRSNLAVLLGVAVGSAVLTGALLVGDSLRGSLRARVERQLGGVDAAAILPRLLPLETETRGPIADSLPGQTAPVLLVHASLQTVGDPASTAYIGGVTALGVDSRFRPIDAGIDWGGDGRTVVLSTRVAEKLGAKAGDRVRLGTERFSDLPRSSSLSKRGSADVTATGEFTVAAVLPPDDPANDFNLTPNPAAPLNVYLPLEVLFELVRPVNLDLKPLRDYSLGANALLARGATAEELNTALRSKLEPEDFGIRFVEARDFYLSVELDRLVFPPAMADAVLAAARDLKLAAEPTVVYIADSLKSGRREIPYPVVAGLNPAAPAPLGQFLPPGLTSLADDEVVLLEWSGSELDKLPDRTELTLAYYDPEVEGEGKLRTAKLTLRAPAGYLQLPAGRVARDRYRYLTPQIRGVTDLRTRLDEIDLPPVLPKQKTDERLPPGHPRRQFIDSPDKATPIAFVNLATAEKLFGSRYGSITSVRVAVPEGKSPESVKEELRKALVTRLNPKDAGLVFEPVRERLLTASGGGTDFGGLFLGFSFFLIVASVLLVGLLFRLALDRRGKEIGLLLAAGYRAGTVRSLVVTEGLILAVAGALAGLAAGVLYNRMLLAVLVELWPDRDSASVLRPHAT
ncbi:MAG TPA: FtsX-like permease family protein, partial [Gemmata sp.]|nr:FtsX-like permease family protein [Gemmata sp.]